MERGDVARLLNVAEADIEDFDDRFGVLKVTIRDGGERIVTSDGVFALDDHPANAQLRRWPHAAKLVGEHGPEIVDPPNDAEAHSSAETVKTLGQTVAEDLVADVPDGTIQDVLDWVGDDADRALQAAIVEEESDKPRSTLLAKLKELMQ